MISKGNYRYDIDHKLFIRIDINITICSEVGRFHSLSVFQLFLPELRIFLTGFSILERPVAVDIEVVAVSVVQVIIRDTLIIQYQ